MAKLKLVYPEKPVKCSDSGISPYVSSVSFSYPVDGEDSEYLLRFEHNTEFLDKNSYLPSITEDVYNVVVKYGNYMRYEPRLRKGARIYDKVNLDNNYPRLPHLIIISDQPLPQPHSKYFQDLTRGISLLQRDNKKHLGVELLKTLPQTLDVIHYLVRYYNNHDQRSLALEIANTHQIDTEDVEIYETPYQWLFEKSVTHYYLGHYLDANKCQDQALVHPRTPAGLRNHFINNIYNFYLRSPLKLENVTPLSIPCHHNYSVMNSSMIMEDDTLYLAVRTVNYIHKTPHYISNDNDKHIRTVTYLCAIDDGPSEDPTGPRGSGDSRESGQGMMTHCLKIHNAVDYLVHRATMIKDIEDMRLFKYNGRFWTIGTGIDTHYQRSHQMVLSRLAVDWDRQDAVIDKMYMLNYASWRIQKNWIPFIMDTRSGDGSALTFIYRYEPFTILEVDPETGECSIYKEIKQPIDCSTFRGSAAPFRYHNSWVMLVHMSRWYDRRNTYIHRFIQLNDDLIITRVSPMFQLTDHHMEYVMGAGYQSSRNIMYLTFSRNDYHGSIGTIPIDTFEDMMYSV